MNKKVLFIGFDEYDGRFAKRLNKVYRDGDTPLFPLYISDLSRDKYIPRREINMQLVKLCDVLLVDNVEEESYLCELIGLAILSGKTVEFTYRTGAELKQPRAKMPVINPQISMFEEGANDAD